MRDIRIEFPAQGKTYCHQEFGIYEYDVYPEGSVNEGLERRRFLDRFSKLSEAQEAFPGATWEGEGSGFREHPLPETPPAWFDPANAGES
jgi:hypothetical protein